LLADDGSQGIAGLGNMGKIDLGLDFLAFAATGTQGPARSLRLTGSTEASPNLFRFVVF
jgi:hypothetical protein